MSYRCGLDINLARLMRVEPGGPRITCDKCGLKFYIKEDRPPPKWLLDNKALPKWKLVKYTDGTRLDLCPECKTK